MKIRLLKEVTVPDHPGVKVGDVFDIATERGEILVRVGNAELVVAKSAAIQTRDPISENRDPVIQPAARKQPRKPA
jgi:hypothetical protein